MRIQHLLSTNIGYVTYASSLPVERRQQSTRLHTSSSVLDTNTDTLLTLTKQTCMKIWQCIVTVTYIVTM